MRISNGHAKVLNNFHATYRHKTVTLNLRLCKQKYITHLNCTFQKTIKDINSFFIAKSRRYMRADLAVREKRLVAVDAPFHRIRRKGTKEPSEMNRGTAAGAS